MSSDHPEIRSVVLIAHDPLTGAPPEDPSQYHPIAVASAYPDAEGRQERATVYVRGVIFDTDVIAALDTALVLPTEVVLNSIRIRPSNDP